MTATAIDDNAGVRFALDDCSMRLLRRLDFRFLLPDSTMQYVGYSGTTDCALFAALTRFCTSVESIPSASPEHRFDLVVARNPRAKDLDRFTERLLPDGCIYAEIQHGYSTATSDGYSVLPWNLRPLSGYVVRLRRLGFHDIDAFWHRPHFDRCVEMIPLTSSDALRYVLNRNASGVKRKVTMSVGRMVARTGLLRHLVPCFSLVAARRES